MAAADHLQAPRQHGLFLHHGIDLGDGTVAHYLEGREILRSPLQEFSRGEPVSAVTYPEGACSPVGVTLRRAMGRIGEQRYNLLFNNCEHFAHWCKTGRHRSAQVEDWLHTGSLGALALGQFVPAALLTGARVLLRQGQSLAETLASGLDPEQLARGRELARRSLEQLDGLRQRLQERLEEELARAERRWGEGDRDGSLATGSDPYERLRLAGQNLADQLAAVEEMEDRLQRLLEPGGPAEGPAQS
ncbi:NC domain-containing protein [Cyanobium sp. Copco_Reservoir_LC18]|uniref:lecithin retinol acyltransferase family protein n=1 Tax=Cyanobium sp. Copco_Reservoir_LC18 TaxID=1328305 RepID=UPI001357CDCF|nr:lecithin retinol acyltransferase family protein [Cyanobium sp. Copco_Reservoir_LC18]KAF0653494.1 NC domain-containing protein [Cyanobium sp. Copco_Reservoir_LC18]